MFWKKTYGFQLNRLRREGSREFALKTAHFSCEGTVEVTGCGLCKVCGKITGEPCRHPDRALASLESCGMDVYQTTKKTPMKYINGANTVTYFGMVLFSEKENG